ncbi:MAG: hypothetical protein J2P18_22255 [Nocardia sp.]|nr:hypothetical protein [Nocardia sp.]
MLRADIDQLNKLAQTLTTIGAAIDDITAGGDTIHPVAGAMPGSRIPATCLQVDSHIEGAYLRVAQRMKGLADTITKSAGNLQTTDDQFAQQMHGLDFHK